MPVARFSKRLSATDTGEARTHQSGILIPVAAGERLFPDLVPGGGWFGCEDQDGRAYRLRFFHRAKANESRITHTAKLISRYLIRAGDTFTIRAPKKAGNPYRIKFEATSDADNLRGEETFTFQPEGAVRKVAVNQYERSPKNRARAIKAHGVRCFGCRLELAETYGEIAKGYIHIHHVKPIADRPQEPPSVDDLIPLCPNCHAIVHLEKPPLSIKRLKELIQAARGPQRGSDDEAEAGVGAQAQGPPVNAGHQARCDPGEGRAGVLLCRQAARSIASNHAAESRQEANGLAVIWQVRRIIPQVSASRWPMTQFWRLHPEERVDTGCCGRDDAREPRRPSLSMRHDYLRSR